MLESRDIFVGLFWTLQWAVSSNNQKISPNKICNTYAEFTFTGIYDGYKKSYAEILYRWGLLQQRAEVKRSSEF